MPCRLRLRCSSRSSVPRSASCKSSSTITSGWAWLAFAQEIGNRLKQAPALLLRIPGWPIGCRRSVPQLGHNAGNLGGAIAQLGPQRIHVAVQHVAAERLDKGQVRQRQRACFVAMADQCAAAVAGRVRG